MVRMMPTRFFEIAQAKARNQMIADAQQAEQNRRSDENITGAIKAFQERRQREKSIDEVRRALSGEDAEYETMEGVAAQDRFRQRGAEADAAAADRRWDIEESRMRQAGRDADRESLSGYRDETLDVRRGEEAGRSRRHTKDWVGGLVGGLGRGVRDVAKEGMKALGKGLAPQSSQHAQDAEARRQKMADFSIYERVRKRVVDAMRSEVEAPNAFEDRKATYGEENSPEWNAEVERRTDAEIRQRFGDDEEPDYLKRARAAGFED